MHEKTVAQLMFRERVYADAYKRCAARTKTAKGPNVKHAELANIELQTERASLDSEQKRLSVTISRMNISGAKPTQTMIEPGLYSITIRGGDASIFMTKQKISNDVWFWTDHVNGESGTVSNWHSENVLPARVVAHDTARIFDSRFFVQ